MYNADSTTAALRDLREIGVRISIEDFGAGYSSLCYLNNFPVDSLKIDRHFVNGVTREPNDAAIAAAIIAMAHSLSLEVVAEGVETEDQLAFFGERQCDRYQGYLLGRAMPAELFAAMLKQDWRLPHRGAIDTRP
jgi:EAL domain-containing protein (putative c-di-GMP-specific phosphodiesterase class I)